MLWKSFDEVNWTNGKLSGIYFVIGENNDVSVVKLCCLNTKRTPSNAWNISELSKYNELIQSTLASILFEN